MGVGKSYFLILFFLVGIALQANAEAEDLSFDLTYEFRTASEGGLCETQEFADEEFVSLPLNESLWIRIQNADMDNYRLYARDADQFNIALPTYDIGNPFIDGGVDEHVNSWGYGPHPIAGEDFYMGFNFPASEFALGDKVVLIVFGQRKATIDNYTTHKFDCLPVELVHEDEFNPICSETLEGGPQVGIGQGRCQFALQGGTDIENAMGKQAELTDKVVSDSIAESGDGLEGLVSNQASANSANAAAGCAMAHTKSSQTWMFAFSLMLTLVWALMCCRIQSWREN